VSESGFLTPTGSEPTTKRLAAAGIDRLGDQALLDSHGHGEMSASDPADTHTFVTSKPQIYSSDARQAALADARGARNLTELARGR
jgi:hypothetical protein